MTLRTLIIVVIGLLSPAPAIADGLPGRVAEGRVEGVEPGAILRLDDGRRVRLALLEDSPAVTGSLTDSLTDSLGALAAGRRVTLHWPTEQHDRHGRLVAHAVRDDGVWLQQALIAEGAARVVTFSDERTAAAALLAVEDTARRAGRGLWGSAAFAPLAALDVAAVDRMRGRLAVVEGVVASAAVVRGRLYLNFGQDWRTDVTVSVRPAALRTFPPEAREAAHWQGRAVRVRGWVQRYNGPLIEADHPEAIEFLAVEQ